MGCTGSKDEEKPVPVFTKASSTRNNDAALSNAPTTTFTTVNELHEYGKSTDVAISKDVTEKEERKQLEEQLNAENHFKQQRLQIISDYDDNAQQIELDEDGERNQILNVFSNDLALLKATEMEKLAMQEECDRLRKLIVDLDTKILAGQNDEHESVLEAEKCKENTKIVQIEIAELQLYIRTRLDEPLSRANSFIYEDDVPDDEHSNSESVFSNRLFRLKKRIAKETATLRAVELQVESLEAERELHLNELSSNVKQSEDNAMKTIASDTVNQLSPTRDRSLLGKHQSEIFDNQKAIDLLCDKFEIKLGIHKGLCRSSIASIIGNHCLNTETEDDSEILNASFASAKNLLSATFRSSDRFILSYLDNDILNLSVNSNNSFSRASNTGKTNSSLNPFQSVTITKNPLKKAGYEHFCFPTARVRPGRRMMVEWSYDVGKSGEVTFGIADANSPAFLLDLNPEESTNSTDDSHQSYPEVRSSASIFRFDSIIGDNLEPLATLPTPYGFNKAGTGRRNVMLVDLRPRTVDRDRAHIPEKIRPGIAQTTTSPPCNLTPNLQNNGTPVIGPQSPDNSGKEVPLETDRVGYCYFFSSSDGSMMNMKPMCAPVPLSLDVPNDYWGPDEVEEDYNKPLSKTVIDRALSTTDFPNFDSFEKNNSVKALYQRHYIPYLCLYYGGESVTVHSILFGDEGRKQVDTVSLNSQIDQLECSVRSSKNTSPTLRYKKSLPRTIPREYEAMVEAMWD